MRRGARGVGGLLSHTVTDSSLDTKSMVSTQNAECSEPMREGRGGSGWGHLTRNYDAYDVLLRGRDRR